MRHPDRSQSRNQSRLLRIKRLAQKKVKIVHRHGKLTIPICRFLVQVASLKPFGHSPKSGTQSHFLGLIAQRQQQTLDLFGPFASHANNV